MIATVWRASGQNARHYSRQLFCLGPALTDATTQLWDLRLKDKATLITGAGRGIGRSCTAAFAEAGAKVIAVARTEADLESLSMEYPKAHSPRIIFESA